MITFNVLDRVFFIRGSEYGTAFTLDRHGRQYLVTARHLVGTDPGRSTIEFFHDAKWKSLPVQVVGFGVGEVDVAVLTPGVRLSEDIPLEPSMGGFALAQDMLFAGYPFKLWADGGPLTYGRPLPFIKKGTLSAYETLTDVKRLWVDAINNEGFSGGPLVFLATESNVFKVTGVVSKYRVEEEHIVNEKNEPTGLRVQYNTGLLLAYGIKHVLDLIDQNPIGLQTVPSNVASQ
jgi:Trypsin-like peptidase domain